MLTSEKLENTISFLEELQHQSGGYKEYQGDFSARLQSTLSAVKALKLQNIAPANVSNTIAFVCSCYDSHTGSFSDHPGQVTKVFSTASALIGLQELEAVSKLGDLVPLATKFMDHNATTPADFFMIIAAYEECRLPPPPPEKAVAFFYSMRQQDGLFGSGTFINAVALAALMRAGENVENIQPVVQNIINSQDLDGSFHGEDGSPDLMTTYAAMRTLVLLNIPPNLSTLKEYLFSLYHEQGGFKTKLNTPASAGATYLVLSLLNWIEEFQKR